MSQCPGCGAFSFVDMDGQASLQDDHLEQENSAQTPGGAASTSDFVDPIEGLLGTAARDVSPSEPAEPAYEFGSSDPAPQAFGPASDPLNLNEFANSEVSSAKDGPLLFRILISGIDTKEIRESIREVLQDSRFAWDSNEIFSKVSKGHLAINDLSPVKASILVTRIKRLPVQIRWEQYAITQGHQS